MTSVFVDVAMVASLGREGHVKRHGSQAVGIPIAAQKGQESDHAPWRGTETADSMQAETRCRIPEIRAGTCLCFRDTLVPQVVIAG